MYVIYLYLGYIERDNREREKESTVCALPKIFDWCDWRAYV